VRNDGTVWAWGLNTSGQLGDGTTTQRATPVQMLFELTGFTHIAAGDNHSVARRIDGHVFAWGSNVAGQLGNATTTSSPIPVYVQSHDASTVAAGGTHSLALLPNGTVEAWGSNSKSQIGDETLVARFTPGVVGSPGRH
jgi:alpha-tubulin suppressor-like RCC1 family protein